MSNPRDPARFADDLLRHDEPLGEAEYQAYRRKLEDALTAAQRREKWAHRVVAASLVVSFTLMVVGGSRVVGDLDPWSREATPASVALGLVYALAVATFLLSAVAYYWWFRPAVGEARERLRDASIRELERQLRTLHEKVSPTAPREKPDRENPQGDPSA